jgi:hypothetical protein
MATAQEEDAFDACSLADVTPKEGADDEQHA